MRIDPQAFQELRGVRTPHRGGFSGQVPLRFEANPQGPLAGEGAKFRSVPNLDHATISRAFRLDPCRMRSDPPRSARDGNFPHGSWPIFLDGFDDPVAKLTVCRESDVFRDADPASVADFCEFGHH